MTGPGPHPKRVLIVEDNEVTRDVMSLILESDGYQVSTAANGRSALERLRGGERPCVILLDLMMPVMDGWQFREEQRRDGTLADIPVVVCTAAGETAQNSALGAAELLSKPVETDDLLAAVRRQCDGSSCCGA
jgi:CheY-like chemotaxis protein